MFFSHKEVPYYAGNPHPLQFNSVEFRDGQQSLFATRMTTDEMIPLLEEMDEVGFATMEMWGGATFDVCIRYLQEDPWERLRIFKQHVKKTPLKMVLRAQNLVGYQAYPDDVVEEFVARAADNGIDIFLTFDALGDLRNCETALMPSKRPGRSLKGPCSTTSVLSIRLKAMSKMPRTRFPWVRLPFT